MGSLPCRLTENQMQILSEIAEEAARKYVLSQVPRQRISVLEIVVETVGSKPITITIDIELELSPVMKKYNAAKLVDEASEKAFAAIEEYIEELECKYRT